LPACGLTGIDRFVGILAERPGVPPPGVASPGRPGTSFLAVTRINPSRGMATRPIGSRTDRRGLRSGSPANGPIRELGPQPHERIASRSRTKGQRPASSLRNIRPDSSRIGDVGGRPVQVANHRLVRPGCPAIVAVAPERPVEPRSRKASNGTGRGSVALSPPPAFFQHPGISAISSSEARQGSEHSAVYRSFDRAGSRSSTVRNPGQRAERPARSGGGISTSSLPPDGIGATARPSRLRRSIATPWGIVRASVGPSPWRFPESSDAHAGTRRDVRDEKRLANQPWSGPRWSVVSTASRPRPRDRRRPRPSSTSRRVKASHRPPRGSISGRRRSAIGVRPEESHVHSGWISRDDLGILEPCTGQAGEDRQAARPSQGPFDPAEELELPLRGPGQHQVPGLACRREPKAWPGGTHPSPEAR